MQLCRKVCRKFMRTKFTVVIAICMVLLALPASAQQAKKHARIGFLTAGGSTTPPAFVQMLRDLGYVEGNNISGELGGKLLEILKEIMPRLTRVVVPGPAPGLAPWFPS